MPTPSGRRFTQEVAVELAAAEHLVFACGRYEGIDSRVTAHYADLFEVDEVSVGDYVLAGGEAAVLVMVEALARLLPGVLGNPESVVDDSFAPGAMAALLEGPIYTKPPEWRGPRGARGAALGRPRPDRAPGAASRPGPGPSDSGPTCSTTGPDPGFGSARAPLADCDGSIRSSCHRGTSEPPARRRAHPTSRARGTVPRVTCGAGEEKT